MAASRANKEVKDLLRQCDLSSDDDSDSNSRAQKPKRKIRHTTSSKSKCLNKPIHKRKALEVKNDDTTEDDVSTRSSASSRSNNDKSPIVKKLLKAPPPPCKSESSISNDGESSCGSEKAVVSHKIPLKSLGTIDPLFDRNVHDEEESHEESQDDGTRICMEFVSDDTHKQYRHGPKPSLATLTHVPRSNKIPQKIQDDIDYDDDNSSTEDPSQPPPFEIKFLLSDPGGGERQEIHNPAAMSSSSKTSTNNVVGKALKRVRSQFSLSNLKRMGKQAQDNLNKTLRYEDPNLYPRKPDRKMLQGEKARGKCSRMVMMAESFTISNVVEPFHWNPVLHSDPNFKNLVECQVFHGLKNNAVGGGDRITIPDWLSPPPITETIMEKKVKFKFETQLKSTLQLGYENARKNQVAKWNKALESRNKNGAKSCQKVFMYISSKMEFTAEILTLKYCNVKKTSLLAFGSHAGVLKLVQFKDLVKSGCDKVCSKMSDISTTVVRNELIDGHTTDVTKLEWLHSEDGMAKLMSVDSQGVLIVWKISEIPGHQRVDLVQDGSFSKVMDFSWSPESKRICIIYSDEGNVERSSIYGLVVGTLDGEREWGKSLSNNNGPPQAVAWLDETKFILVQGNALSMHCYTDKLLQTRHFDEDELGGDHASLGKLVSFLIKPCTALENTGPFRLGLIWQRKIALLRTVSDNHSLIFDPQLTISSCDWSRNGSYIAVAGRKLNNKELDCSQINIYSSTGSLLTILKIEEPSIVNLSWDADSMNLAIGSETLLYVASARIAYKFASNGCIYAYAFSIGSENFVGVWDKTNINIQKVDGKVVDLKNHGNRFALLSINSQGIYSVAVLSKRGYCIDALVILTMEPFEVCLTDVCLICLSANSILLWRYNSSLSQRDFEEEALPLSPSLIPNTGDKQDDKTSKFTYLLDSRQIHIDDIPTFSPRMRDTFEETTDAAVCMDAKFDRLIVARNSGKLQMYCLPQGGLLQTIEVSRFSPFQIMLNPTKSKIALLDISGSLRLGYVENNGTEMKVDVDVISTGVLNMLWSSDMPDFLCVMKRTEMCIIRYAAFERFSEYNALSGYLAGFDNMRITLLNLDEILLNPSQPNASHVIEVDMQILEQLPQNIKNWTPQQTSIWLDKVSRINHPRLWNTLGEEHLKLGNFQEAHHAFVNSQNYSALQFMKKLEVLEPNLKTPNILAFLEDYESASNSFVGAKRTDLALQMWNELAGQKHGLLAQINGSGDVRDSVSEHYSLEKAEKYYQDGEFTKALKIFKTLKQYDRVFDCFMVLDNCKGLEGLLERIPKKDPLTKKIAEKYAFIGMTKEAVAIYLESGSPKKAVEVALANMEWSLALEIAHQHSIPMVAQSILDLTKQLLSSGNIMEAVQFLKKCGKTFAAGKLLATVALREMQSPSCTANILNIKKLFVMAATLLQQRITTTQPRSSTRTRTKNSRHFPPEDEIDIKFDEYIPHKYQPTVEEFRWMRVTPWRGALGVQFLILTTVRIHLKRFDRAIVLATHLRNYTDILGAERINCLIALASAHGGNLIHCLGALSQLDNITEDYSELAVEFLAANEKKKEEGDDENSKKEKVQSPTTLTEMRMCCGAVYEKHGESAEQCPVCDLRLPFCIISGQVLTKKAWKCGNCGASAARSKLVRYRYCPLCHQETTTDN